MESHAITPELWQLAVKLHVLLCYPAASADRRQTLGNAIGAQMVGVTLEHLRRDCPEELAVYSARLSATYPEYNAKALRRISERFVHQHELAMRVGKPD